MQIKTTMRYHLTPIRMSIIKMNTNKCCWGSGEREPLYASGNIKWCSHCGKQYGSFSKNWKYNYCMTQKFHSWVYIQKNQKHWFKQIHTQIFIATLFTIVKICKQPKHSSTDKWVKKMCFFLSLSNTHRNTTQSLKKWNFATCSNMDGLGGHYAKWNKSYKDR